MRRGEQGARPSTGQFSEVAKIVLHDFGRFRSFEGLNRCQTPSFWKNERRAALGKSLELAIALLV